jgi:hypothetical protein
MSKLFNSLFPKEQMLMQKARMVKSPFIRRHGTIKISKLPNFLFPKGADVHAVAEIPSGMGRTRSMTPLGIASNQGNTAVVEYLAGLAQGNTTLDTRAC